MLIFVATLWLASLLVGCKNWLLQWFAGGLHRAAYMLCCTGEYQKVCKLHNAIYGLKRSLQAWLEKFNRTLILFGFCFRHRALYFWLSMWKILWLMEMIKDAFLILRPTCRLSFIPRIWASSNTLLGLRIPAPRQASISSSRGMFLIFSMRPTYYIASQYLLIWIKILGRQQMMMAFLLTWPRIDELLETHLPYNDLYRYFLFSQNFESVYECS